MREIVAASAKPINAITTPASVSAGSSRHGRSSVRGGSPEGTSPIVGPTGSPATDARMPTIAATRTPGNSRWIFRPPRIATAVSTLIATAPATHA